MSILDFVTIKSTDKELHQIITFQNHCRNNDDKTIDNNNPIKVFTDGACIHNGKKFAKAGIGIYFGKDDCRNISERISGKQCNNTAELKALIKAYKILENDINNNKLIHIYSDSNYAIKCCKDYGLKMYKNNWKKNNSYIPNYELVKKAFLLFHNKNNIKLIHVKAHTNNKDELSLGNLEADRLAGESINIFNKSFKKEIKKNYLNVPFSHKDKAKELGAKWDRNNKKWYYLDNIENNKIELIKLFG